MSNKYIEPKYVEKHGGITLWHKFTDKQFMRALQCGRKYSVSVITLTYNRPQFVGMMIANWNNIMFPKDLIEWIIVDDSDDFYFPGRLMSCVRLIMEYNCIGVGTICLGIYDLTSGNSFSLSQNENEKTILEGTMVFRKSWIDKHPFQLTMNGDNEGESLVLENEDKWIDLHFMFNMIAISHFGNFTQKCRCLGLEKMDYEKNYDFHRDMFLDNFKIEFQKMLLYNNASP